MVLDAHDSNVSIGPTHFFMGKENREMMFDVRADNAEMTLKSSNNETVKITSSDIELQQRSSTDTKSISLTNSGIKIETDDLTHKGAGIANTKQILITMDTKVSEIDGTIPVSAQHTIDSVQHFSGMRIDSNIGDELESVILGSKSLNFTGTTNDKIVSLTNEKLELQNSSDIITLTTGGLNMFQANSDTQGGHANIMLNLVDGLVIDPFGTKKVQITPGTGATGIPQLVLTNTADTFVTMSSTELTLQETNTRKIVAKPAEGLTIQEDSDTFVKATPANGLSIQNSSNEKVDLKYDSLTLIDNYKLVEVLTSGIHIENSNVSGDGLGSNIDLNFTDGLKIDPIGATSVTLNTNDGLKVEDLTSGTKTVTLDYSGLDIQENDKKVILNTQQIRLEDSNVDTHGATSNIEISMAGIRIDPTGQDFVELNPTKLFIENGIKSVNLTNNQLAFDGELDVHLYVGKPGTSGPSSNRPSELTGNIIFNDTFEIGMDRVVNITGNIRGASAEFEQVTVKNNLEVNGDGKVIGVFEAQAVTCDSDKRLKKNIVTISNSLDIVRQLRGVTFNWNQESDSDPLSYGFIAQEIEAVLPTLVHTNDVTGLKSVDYQKVVSVLVNAVNELRSEVETLKAQLA